LALIALGPVAVPVTVAHAQSAGDEQYQDPFSSGTSGSGTTTSPPPLSSKPQAPKPSRPSTPASTTPAPSSPASPSSSSPSTQTAPTTAAAQLPNTGTDARLLVLLGLALVICGVGLRLRTAPERF
jgi:LPXTG-motif cell wall-anchored protein